MTVGRKVGYLAALKAELSVSLLEGRLVVVLVVTSAEQKAEGLAAKMVARSA